MQNHVSNSLLYTNPINILFKRMTGPGKLRFDETPPMFYTSCNGTGICRTVSITKEEVIYAAGLAKIGMTDQDVEKFTAELDGILHWMEALNKISIPNDLPLYRPKNLVGERTDTDPTPDYSTQLMANAPDPQHNFFGVPKVIE